jgi:hypothetical protein
MTTTNAATQIIASCDAVFQKGWENQIENLRSRYAEWVTAKERAEADKLGKPLYSISVVNAETFFYRTIYGVEKGNPYTGLKQMARANFNEMCHAMYEIDKAGFEAYIEKERASYIEFLTAYLRLSLEKKEVQNYAEAANIRVNGSAKGYKVTALVDGRHLITDCIPVGGYNIVRFHYRYTVKF